ncbi:hypothetical protein HN873_049299 [Arachis hypogaea]
MRAHPNHILKKYSSSNLVIIPPEADLHRDNIYLLVPLPPPPSPSPSQPTRCGSTSAALYLHAEYQCTTTREAAVEREKLLKDASDEYLNTENVGSTGYVEISTMATISFVVIASCFLLMLYKLMASWFIEVLVVLFCIGGVEVRYSFPDFVPIYYDHSLTPPFRVD